MKKFIKNTANSIRTKAIRLAATRRSGEGYIDTAVKILIAVVLGALLLAGLYASPLGRPGPGGLSAGLDVPRRAGQSLLVLPHRVAGGLRHHRGGLSPGPLEG